MGFFGFAISYILFSALHFFQFVLALVVCGLYGVDLDRARKAGVYSDGKWVSPLRKFSSYTYTLETRRLWVWAFAPGRTNRG